MRVVSSEVACPRITSTSAISGTGFMKCMPMTFSGRRVAAPSLVIEIDDVLEARMASGRVEAVQLREDLRLDLEVLDDRLDDEVGGGDVAPSSVVARMRPERGRPLARR